MKSTCYLLFFIALLMISSGNTLLGQNTYVNKLSYNTIGYYQHTITSDLMITSHSITADNGALIIAHDMSSEASIYRLDSNGNVVAFIANVSWLSLNQQQYAGPIRATLDNGFIYAYVHENFTNSAFAYIYKAGINSFQVTLPSASPLMQLQSISDIAVMPGNQYAVAASDSIFIYDDFGQKIRALPYVVARIFAYANGDLLINANQFHGRITNTGTHLWSYPNGTLIRKDSTTYALTTDSLIVLDNNLGSVISKILLPPLSLQNIDILSSGGLVGNLGGTVYYYDSLGQLQWFNQIPIANAPVTAFELANHKIFVGGEYYSKEQCTSVSDKSLFVSTLNQNGTGLIDSCSLVWPGDADSTGTIYIDDLLYMILSLNQTGTSMVNSFNAITPPSCRYSDVYVDWASSYGTGTNHKHGDVDGNGIIDTADVTSLEQEIDYGCGPYPLLGFFAPLPQSTGGNVSLEIVPAFDTINAGDTLRFLIILGNAITPVDSIFGFALAGTLNPYLYATNSGVPTMNGLIPGNDLAFNTSLYCSPAPYRGLYSDDAIVVARRDNQNAYMVNDTVAYIDIPTTPNISASVDVTFNVTYFLAITADGFPLAMHTNTTPVHVFRLMNAVTDPNPDQIKILPNPASDYLLIDGLGPEKKSIRIYSSNGKLTDELTSKDQSIKIDTHKFDSGIYMINISSERWNKVFKVLVNH